MKTYIIDADNIDGDLFFYNLTRNSNDFSMLPIFELDRIAQKIRNILTRMLVFVSKSHRKGLKNYGKNFKT
ncbi:hypothetical protein E5D84_06990 [Helicobacter pylori]|nr:hypothetical protein E5D84_06990 [Helicobacter pylori]WQT12686.1 hypothetical protein E5A83_06895 [Helicobacter pylori]